MELDEFVEKNIVEINDSINNFKLDKNREYTDLEIKNYLKSKLINDIYKS